MLWWPANRYDETVCISLKGIRLSNVVYGHRVQRSYGKPGKLGKIIKKSWNSKNRPKIMENGFIICQEFFRNFVPLLIIQSKYKIGNICFYNLISPIHIG